MDPELLEKFTSHLKSVLVRAYNLAHEIGAESIGIDHLLWSLLTERGSIGAEILGKAHLSPDRLRERIAAHAAALPAGGERAVPPQLNEETKRAIEKAVFTANQNEHKYVGTEHLLSGMLAVDGGFLVELLTAQNVDIDALKQQLAVVLTSTSKFPEIAEGVETAPVRPHRGDEPKPDAPNRGKKGSKTPALDFFTVDLTGADVQKRIDPVIGREPEIARVIEILSRRTKNNPLLLGEPGVGKTAIVEGLARRVVAGEVPDALRRKKILALDLALVVAGTMYRGEFEGRLKQIIDEVKAHPDVILFLDEIHTITGAGSASGSLDAANILKPALARGEIRCIGATTFQEYKKNIESDAALDRRFQSLEIKEPSAAETREILAGVKQYYEKFHNVKIQDAACADAVALAERYLPERHFPDKALDLIDEAGAAVKIRASVQPHVQEARALEAAIDQASRRKQDAVAGERYVEALEWKERENRLRAKLGDARESQSRHGRAPVGTVRSADVAAVVGRITGIPAQELTREDADRLLTLEDDLRRHVFGQDHVLSGVADAIRRARAGLAFPGRPLASFLFMGPSGVGKTELAKAIATTVFHDPKALVRLDMSEFGESFTVAKLLGAPAGYVGYRDANKLTDAVKRRPYCVVLFDEVEKAHPDVLNLLLQILDDGQVTDASGKTVSFRQTVIVLTSNVGLERYLKGPFGFGDAAARGQIDEQDLRREALTHFRPELINRIDRVLVFQPLAAAHLELIVAEEVRALAARLEERRVALHATPEAIRHLTALVDAPEKGARAVRAVVQEQVEAPAARLLLGAGERRIRNLILEKRADGLALVTRTPKRTARI